MKICTDKFVLPFYLDLAFLDTIKTWDYYSYNTGGFEEPESDLFMYLENDILNTLDSRNQIDIS